MNTPSPIRYRSFDPTPCAFPRPQIPLLPEGVECTVVLPGRAAAATPMPPAHYRHFSRARYALLEAFRIAGIGAGTTLLAPSYHCRTMIDGAIRLGAEIVFYPLDEQLAPRPESIERLLAASAASPVRALLATHYFGRPCGLERIAELCRRHSVRLIEDCAHALVTPWFRPPGVGDLGDLVVASPYKFFPSPDGGLLYSPRQPLPASLQPMKAPASLELRAVLRGLRDIVRGPSRRGHPTPCPVDRDALARRPFERGDDRETESGAPSVHFASEEECRQCLSWSRRIQQRCDIDTIREARQENFRRLAEGVADLACGRQFLPGPPADSVPYMFPLLIDFPDPHFYWLKAMGFPIWRWDDLAVSDCPTAREARLRLLHLPCHQGLGPEEIQWMIDVLRTVLAKAPSQP